MAVFSPLLDVLADVPDPRRAEGKLYKLPHVLLFSILAIVAGCNSYRGVERRRSPDIVTFVDVHRRKLNAAFGLNWRRAPSHTAIRYILQGLDPAGVEAAFRRHAALLQAARATPGQGSIALDGKTLRGSFDGFHDRTARPGAERVRHRHRAGARPHRHRRDVQRDPGGADVAGRTRRRPRRHRHPRCAALPEKHFEVAAVANVALIVQVKDNQPTLHQRIQEASATTTAIGSAHSHDKGRNRDERRTVTVFDPTDKLADTDWHPHVAAIIRVERHVDTRNAKTGLLRRSAETAFYISNTPVTAARAAEAIRAHRKIENTSHYTRDVTLGEDRSRICTNPGVFARLRSFAFNILKVNQTDTLSQDRYRAGLAGIKNLLSLTVSRKR